MRPLIALALLLSLVTGAAAHELPANLEPCVYEDSNNCHWDARVQGNGKGRSYVVIDEHVIYLD